MTILKNVGTARFRGLWKKVKDESNFFRIHVTVFTITPLIFSGIFFACNGQFHIAYIDSLFMCYSAMTTTGLTTINLSSLTGWQQAILFILMLAGDLVRSLNIILYDSELNRLLDSRIACHGSRQKVSVVQLPLIAVYNEHLNKTLYWR